MRSPLPTLAETKGKFYDTLLTLKASLNKRLIILFVMFVATCITGGIAIVALNGHPQTASTITTTTVVSAVETTAMTTATTRATSNYTTTTTTIISTAITTAEAGECR